MSSPIHALLYRSVAARAFPPGELLALIEQAQARNGVSDITGLLIHGSMRALPHVPGAFVQWLEGPEESVDTIYRAVAEDPRHQSVEVLARGTLASMGFKQRLFSRWAMGMLSMSELPATLEGFLSVYHERGFGGSPRHASTTSGSPGSGRVP